AVEPRTCRDRSACQAECERATMTLQNGFRDRLIYTCVFRQRANGTKRHRVWLRNPEPGKQRTGPQILIEEIPGDQTVLGSRLEEVCSQPTKRLSRLHDKRTDGTFPVRNHKRVRDINPDKDVLLERSGALLHGLNLVAFNSERDVLTQLFNQNSM